MAVDRYKVEEFLYSNCNKVRRDGQGYVLRCPVCGDSKKNASKRRCHVDFYEKYDEWVYKCYNGDCPEPSGNIQSLYARVLGVTWKEADNLLGDKKYDSNKLLKKLSGEKTQYKDEKDEHGTLDLSPADCLSIHDVPKDASQEKYITKLKQFVVRRRIPLSYAPMVCFNGRYKNRFIIPVYIDGEMVYFQGRAMYDFMEPKFLNPVVKKEEIILNSDHFDRAKYIVVCEGLVDAMMVGTQGTACLGATISDEFLDKVFAMTDVGVIVALDNPDVDKSGMRNYAKIIEESKYAKRLRYFFMPDIRYKDLNDYVKAGSIETLRGMYDFVVENSADHFKASIKIRNVL
jgi:hypothetical protein